MKKRERKRWMPIDHWSLMKRLFKSSAGSNIALSSNLPEISHYSFNKARSSCSHSQIISSTSLTHLILHVQNNTRHIKALAQSAGRLVCGSIKKILPVNENKSIQTWTSRSASVDNCKSTWGMHLQTRLFKSTSLQCNQGLEIRMFSLLSESMACQISLYHKRLLLCMPLYYIDS